VSVERTRVLIVDDSFVVRAGLRDFVAAQPDFAVIAEAANGREALIGDGISATREIVRELPETKVLVLTWLEDPVSLRDAVFAGAKGYLVHGTFASDELAHALRVLTDEGALITPVLAGELLRSVDAREAPQDVAERLTPRERQILSQVQAGRTNREIAQTLGIEEKTVKNHINSLYSKLAISSRLEAMAAQRPR
jgi:DNA-binding NarL/FixJ family response regulator